MPTFLKLPEVQQIIGLDQRLLKQAVTPLKMQMHFCHLCRD